ncbi:hypothetical protein K8P10_000803 [Leucobacter sp. Psy1]|nr:hypothetical protein K8P10_000803 [Leucobacter sp. Psy1]
MEADRSVPVEPSGSRLRQRSPIKGAAALAVSELGGSVEHASDENFRRALSVEENQHNMTMFSTRWSHGPGTTKLNRDDRSQGVTR